MTAVRRRHQRILALLVAGVVTAPVAALVAQDGGVTLDVGRVIEPAPLPVGIPDSVLRRALALFNAPATSKVFGGSQFPANVDGSLGVYNAPVLLSGRVQGDVIVINGDLRLQAGGHIDGEVIVLGGRFSADPGTTYQGPVTEYRSRAAVRLTSEFTLEQTPPAPSLRELTERAAIHLGNLVISPRLAAGVYNRVEGLPIHIGPSLAWDDGRQLTVEANADLILRTARDPGGTRGGTGWHAQVSATRSGQQPITVGLSAGDRVVPTADSTLSPIESSLNAVLFRRDYRDWFGQKGVTAFLDWQPRPALTLSIRAASQRQRSLNATSPFALLREGNAWRRNPLVDDGRFTIIDLRARWTTGESGTAPRHGWNLAIGTRRTTSNDITPVLLPEQVRDPLPAAGYAAYEASFDVRRIQRLDPRNAIHLRVAGRGWVGGDPLTVQRRMAINGADPFAGYAFRSVTCDPRRQVDPSVPALCDRQMIVQAEFRRTIDLHLATQLGPYGLGIEQADLMVFSDFGSAWVAGDGPGQVPSGRIQALEEWRADVGVGIDAGWIGAYLARSLTDDEPFRLSFRLQRRF